MIKNYFKITLRNLWKNKTFSFLNIMGLAIGIASAALIFLWVEDEVNFNHHFSKRDYVYRIMESQKNDGKINVSGSTPGPMAEAVKADIPGIKNSGRLSWNMDELIVMGDKSIKESGAYVDPSILSMLTFSFIYGDARDAFKEIQSVVISETLSRKFFGSDNPIGKTLKMAAGQGYSVDGVYTVTGVYKDLPQNSSYKFQWLSPYIAFENKNDWMKPWDNNLTETLVELSPTADPEAINKKLEHYLTGKKGIASASCLLFSMNDWHLRDHFTDGKPDGGNIKYVKLFSLIATIILLIACINFMNLSTALSEKRAREVGVRKVMGAGRGRLVTQFFGESLMMAFLAIIVAVGIIYLALPMYSLLVKKSLESRLFTIPHLGFLVGTGLITGLVAGSYPAFYLSSFNPVSVLKGTKLKMSFSAIFIRRGLVISQFSISIILIICTTVIYQQVQHIKQRDLGYSKDNIIFMDLQENIKSHFSNVRGQLMATGLIENAAMSLHDPLHIYSYTDKFSWQGKDPNSKMSIYSNMVSPEFLSLMHMKIMEGRDFYPTPGADSGHIIINESMARLMGKEGKPGAIVTNGTYQFQVVGIIKDVVYNDVYASGTPLLMGSGARGATVLTIRIKPNVNMADALAKIEAIFKVNNPGYPFEFKFLDEEFDQLFSTETLIGKLAGIFSVLAIFISCLGLFGLAAYTAEHRRKEIGIRKVLGASAEGLAGLLSKEFMRLVALSCLIAFPLSWWAMHNWLQDYQYRTTIHWWIFILAGIVSLSIALVTVSFQAIKVAVANPITSLRAE
jgi:ABC-type antimicrobial peptide transport system permease subunit